jgi:hypothetical protein
MGHAIGDILVYAVGVAISPVAIIAVVLMLSTPRGRVNGPAFVLGWIVGLAVAGTVLLLIGKGVGASSGGSPSTGASIAKIVFGVLLLGVASRQWRGRPHGDAAADLPGWMKGIDKFKPYTAAGAAVGLATVNPKNLVLILGATAAISGTGISAGKQAGAYAVFVVIATLGTAIPVLIAFLLGERGRRMLDDLRTWMTRENAVIMAVICLVIAAKLIGEGITGLT